MQRKGKIMCVDTPFSSANNLFRALIFGLQYVHTGHLQYRIPKKILIYFIFFKVCENQKDLFRNSRAAW